MIRFHNAHCFCIPLCKPGDVMYTWLWFIKNIPHIIIYCILLKCRHTCQHSYISSTVTAFILVNLDSYTREARAVALTSPHPGFFMFHFTFSVQRRALYLMNSTAGEMNSEACGRHSPLSTVEGLTSKPLFIPQLTVVRQPKCQWVRSYLQACFRCPLFHEGTLPKKSSSLRTSGGFSSLGNKQSALTAACWGEQNGPVLFSFLYLLRFFSFFLICPDRVAMTTQLSPIGSGSPSPHSFFFTWHIIFPPSCQNYTSFMLSCVLSSPSYCQICNNHSWLFVLFISHWVIHKAVKTELTP